MFRLLIATLATLMFSLNATAADPASATTPSKTAPEKTQVVLLTSLGKILVELHPEEAPITVANFLEYVDSGHYDGVIFHRVVPNFVVQTGGFDRQYQQKATRTAIVNESNNGLRNLRGTLSMARTASVDSATAQFFISLNDNPSLDWRPNRPGYAVFGRVIEGMAFVDQMAGLPQGNHHGVFANAPNDPITIIKAYRPIQNPVSNSLNDVAPAAIKPALDTGYIKTAPATDTP